MFGQFDPPQFSCPSKDLTNVSLCVFSLAARHIVSYYPVTCPSHQLPAMTETNQLPRTMYLDMPRFFKKKKKKKNLSCKNYLMIVFSFLTLGGCSCLCVILIIHSFSNRPTTTQVILKELLIIVGGPRKVPFPVFRKIFFFLLLLLLLLLLLYYF